VVGTGVSTILSDGERMPRTLRAIRRDDADVKLGVTVINSGPGTTADTLARWAGTAEHLG
jgi:hypothetical protein